MAAAETTDVVTSPQFMDAMILLSGAVLGAPLFKRIGLGTILGYLGAGVVIGPVLGLIDDAEEILHFSELGVVMLLFIIGLELKPTRLWAMRRDILGLGALQVFSCGILLTLLASQLLERSGAMIVVGFGLSLSSTAFALQMLEASGDMNTLHGRKAFSILLFQDIVIIPFLAILPLLGRGDEGEIGIQTFFYGISAIAVVFLVGRYLLTPMFRLIARTGAREVSIALALLIVFSSAILMEAIGLSMALGAFIAGVVLAESSYRHQLEADIEPFRGLLLGLFFMAIGMSLNTSVLVNYWYIVLLCAPIAMAVKSTMIYFSCRLFGNSRVTSIRVAAVLPQHGEFGFVLFASAFAGGVISSLTGSLLVAIVTLSMALTPLTVYLGEKIIAYITKDKGEDTIEEDFEGAGSTVMMIGFSRMGQVVAQSLLASGSELTIIDNNVDHIRNASKFGFRIYFGDGRRREVLQAAGIEQAELVTICTHKAESTTAIVDMIQRNWPDKKLYVRTYDRSHHLQILDKGVEFPIRETFESAMVMAGKMLEGLGLSHEQSERVLEDIRRLDIERLEIQRNEGINSGMHMLHTRAVKPEPLIEPKKESTALDDRSRLIVEADEES